MPPKSLPKPRMSKKDRLKVSAAKKKDAGSKTDDGAPLGDDVDGEGEDGVEEGDVDERDAPAIDSASVATSVSAASKPAATPTIPKSVSSTRAAGGSGALAVEDTRSAVDKAIDGVAITFAAPKNVHRNTRGTRRCVHATCTGLC